MLTDLQYFSLANKIISGFKCYIYLFINHSLRIPKCKFLIQFNEYLTLWVLFLTIFCDPCNKALTILCIKHSLPILFHSFKRIAQIMYLVCSSSLCKLSIFSFLPFLFPEIWVWTELNNSSLSSMELIFDEVLVNSCL